MFDKEKYDTRPVMDDLIPDMFIGIFEAEEHDKTSQKTQNTEDEYSLDTSVMDY